jgi:A/G-specific adenine glycosylase
VSDDFTQRLLAWFDAHGRKDLPWQASRDAYRVWVSEIMLQQTQVATVIPYYERFLTRFPDIAALAHAPLDEVLYLWTGLGYYARARNLQRAAQAIVAEHGGRFPIDVEAVAALPGIGPSTAGAILAFAFDQPHAILDGNVKRVLTRYHGVAGWPGKKVVEQQLWALARTHTPQARVADYTQAIMDLGATVCRRTPECVRCPQASGCVAYAQGDPQAYPTPAPRKSLPARAVAMLMIGDDAGCVLLQRRAPTGIWGGLWGFPECDPEEDVLGWARRTLGLELVLDSVWPRLRHTFSHFHLDITPIPARLVGASGGLMENGDAVWYNVASPDARGLAAPVKRLLEQLRNTQWPAPFTASN